MPLTSLRQVIGPLLRPLTYRRAVHLLLGGVILIPYVVLAVGFWQLYLDPSVPVVPVTVLAVVTAVIGTVPPFLPALRGLEIAAARSLLGVELPEPDGDPTWPTRSRAAAWYVLHLVSGGVVAFALLYAIPASVLTVAEQLGGAEAPWVQVDLVPFTAVEGLWVIPVAVALVVATVYVAAWLGSSMAAIAPALLGPSQEERIATLESAARRLAERNRLARELHDSVGHALTVTTLQAAAARQVLDTDPEFVRRALTAVEEAGRAAMDDLDHVLGLLRSDAGYAAGDPGGTPARTPEPQRTLADLDRLAADTRAAGVEVAMTVDGDLRAVSPAASREAYRIVQEGLTNSLRHAGDVPVTLQVTVDPGGLGIVVVNPVQHAAAIRSDGRGLRGMHERVGLLQGEMSAGIVDGMWRVEVRLPEAPPGVGEDR